MAGNIYQSKNLNNNDLLDVKKVTLTEDAAEALF